MKLIVLILFLNLSSTVLAGFFPKSFEASFVQIKKSKLTKREKKSNIKIKYLFPGNLYFKDMAEDGDTFVCNKLKTWQYTPPFIEGEEGEVKIGDSKKFCYSKVFDVLNEGLKSNKKYKVSKLSDTALKLEFSKETQEDLGSLWMNLNFKSKDQKFSNLKSLDVQLKNDKYPTVFLLETIASKKLDPKNFIFEIPEKTKITRLK